MFKLMTKNYSKTRNYVLKKRDDKSRAVHNRIVSINSKALDESFQKPK